MVAKLPPMPPGQACQAPSVKYPDGARGTIAGATRHYRTGEDPCPECLDAKRADNAQRMRIWRAEHPEEQKAISDRYEAKIKTDPKRMEHRRQANHDRYMADRENRLAYQKAKHDADPEAYRAAVHARRAANRELYRETHRQWCENNRERRRKSNRDYRANNAEKVTAADHAKRQRRRAADDRSPPSKAELLKRDGPACFYCGTPFTGPEDRHLDHVVPIAKGGGNDPRNCVLACASCNISKHARDLHEWLALRQRRGLPVTERALNLAPDASSIRQLSFDV